MRSRKTGFTLIEILVVLSLMGVLFGLSIGFVARAGKGNLVLQAAQSLASQIETSKAQSRGSDSAYVKIESSAGGKTTIRSYRHRQVFHWPCEDLARASEEGVLIRHGKVAVGQAGKASGEGRHVEFGGGRVELGNPPWLQFVDGFNIKCRLNPSPDASASSVRLFRKGTYLVITLVRSGAGRYDLEATVKLVADAGGEGGGDYKIRTGFREAAEVDEWKSPVLAGRWQDIQISFDRNEFTIHVNERLRAVRSDRKNAMKPELVAPFVIGDGYQGGFDSLLLSGIFEDDEDLYRVPPQVLWVDEAGQPIVGKTRTIHFRNRTLDPHRHLAPVEVIFKLNDEKGARRIVQVTLSGETFVKRPGE